VLASFLVAGLPVAMPIFKRSRPGVNIIASHNLGLRGDLDYQEVRSNMQVEPTAVHPEATVGFTDADPSTRRASLT
jgi:hypothetical protein